jgi:hypothetical protein
MPTVRVCVDITEDHFRAYQDEAGRRGVSVEELVQQMVQGLVEELDRDEREGTDHPIIPA